MNEEIKDKSLHFVLRYYKEGQLDTRNALRKVRQRAQLPAAHVVSLRQWMAMAASLLLLICGGAYYLYKSSHQEVLLAAHDKSELFILPDSTHITLSPHSTLLYYKGDSRTVTLNGSAYFEVKHDEQHPFTISNDMAQVRVLGTKFQVNDKYQERTATEVYVTDGKVAFSPKEENGQELILTKGMKARLLQGEHIPQLIPAGSINQVAWATGTFHFDNTPLTEVLFDLEQFYQVKLHASSTDKRLSGDFETGRLDEIILLIEQVLGVDIREERREWKEERGETREER